uniref:Methyltransferase type 11 domain-containing protein n=1 Tax=Photinus pyralis TaxID=7054 RepID=A0A1Y1MKB3_PHOPY
MGECKSPTVIPQQMQCFTKRSATWWDKNSTTGVLHKYDEVMFDQMKKVLQERWFISDASVALKNFKLLDAGCGGGILSEQFARTGCTVVGIDVNESLINVAKQHQALDSSLVNLSYSWETIEDHAARNPGKYDVIVLNFVLSHARHRETLVRSCIQALRPGGIFFVTAANKTIAGWLRIVLLEQIIHGILPKNSHSWKLLYSLSKLRRVLAQNACVVKEYRGLMYCRDTSLLKWVDDTAGFYFVYAIKE